MRRYGRNLVVGPVMLWRLIGHLWVYLLPTPVGIGLFTYHDDDGEAVVALSLLVIRFELTFVRALTRAERDAAATAKVIEAAEQIAKEAAES